MCGIAGFIDFNKKSDSQILKCMTDAIAHRGPDGEGHFFERLENCHIGLGHRRLAIIDLTESGKQPMEFQHVIITYNGEIYNFQEIKTELTKLEHQFIGNSDTEVILHAYKQWGKNCIQRFIGMFALVIYDRERQQIFCARDRSGVKPFFYYWQEGNFFFASELKALHQHPSFDKRINTDAVSAFMQYGNVPSEHCIFSNTYKLLPGNQLTLDMKTNSIQIEQYWNVYHFYNREKRNITYLEAKKETTQLLKTACEYRMVADVPIGIFLSGGYDSSLLTALLQSERTEKLKTFTIAVPDIGLNEAPFAQKIANHLGTDHTEINCTSKEVMEMIEDIPFYYDEPYADSSALPTMLVSKMARKNVTVALSADGGDEIFAGYNRYDYLMRYKSKMNRIPNFARKGIVKAMNRIPSQQIPILKNRYNFHNRYEKLKGILIDPSDEKIMLSLSQQFTDDQMSKFMSVEPKILKTYYDSAELQQEFYSPLSYMMAIDYQTYLVDDVLQKVDRATMSVSLEGREPFLDHRIIEYVATLPDNFKFHDGIKKKLLKDIAHDYVPRELLDRPKMGFAIPIADWLHNDLRELVEFYCSSSKLKEHELFDHKEVQQLITRFYSGKKELDVKIWYLLMFQMWYAKWMK